MTRLEKAYEKYPEGIWEDSRYVSKEDFVHEYCPYNLQIDEEDFNWNELKFNNSMVIGCRNISCIECWNKEC